MTIEVVRIGQRLVRDDRVTTHVALVSRAFGAERIIMTEANPGIRETMEKINGTWGGGFEVRFVDSWRPVVRARKAEGFKVVHLSMYGRSIPDVQGELRRERDLLVVVGAKKVPRDIYGMADYNVGIGSQPHSEISALAVLLDRVQQGRQFEADFAGARMRIIPAERGKNVQQARGGAETRD